MNVKCALWVTLMLFSNGPLFAQTHGYFESVDSTDFETNDGPNTAFYQQGFLATDSTSLLMKQIVCKLNLVPFR